MRICVVGSGQLGAKIAGELVLYGHRVKLSDRDPRRLDAAYTRIMQDRDNLRRDGLLTAGQEQSVGQLYCLSGLEDALHDAELVIEAIVEDLEAKKQLFEEICKACSESVILTSNSLTLHLDEIFADIPNSGRSIGMRFLFPVYCIPEVELTPHSTTSPDTLNFVRRFISQMGKIAYLRGDRPVILTEEEREIRKLEAAANSSFNNLGQLNEDSSASTGVGSGPGGNSLHFSRLAMAARSFKPSQQAFGDNNQSNVANNGGAGSSRYSNNDCAVCLDNPRDTVLEPCRHLVTCMACAKTLQRRRDACPVCRSPIVDVIHVFNS